MAQNTWKSWDVCVVASSSSSSDGAEWLGESVHKRPTLVHVIVIPCLLTAVHNQLRASAEGQAASVMMRQTTKLMKSTCPMNGKWFEHFMLGFHKRVGDVSCPDLAVWIEVMLALMERFDRLWILADGDRKKQEEVLFPALFAIAAYAGGLRGEEDLFSMFKHFAEGMNHPKHPHVVMALRGRFKNSFGFSKC